MPKSIDRRPYTIGVRYASNLVNDCVILDGVEYDITFDRYVATYHWEHTDELVNKPLSEFLDQFTLATPADVPLASEPEPVWWKEVKELASKISTISHTTVDELETSTDEEKILFQIATLAELIEDLSNTIAALRA